MKEPFCSLSYGIFFCSLYHINAYSINNSLTHEKSDTLDICHIIQMPFVEDELENEFDCSWYSQGPDL